MNNSNCICCDSCDQWIHRKCSGLSTFQFMQLNEDPSSTWLCGLCFCDILPFGHLENVEAEYTIVDIMKELKKINKQNDLILDQNRKIKEELATFKLDISKRVEVVENDIGEMKVDMNYVKKSQQFQSDQYDAHNNIQKKIEGCYINYEKAAKILENKIVELEKSALDEKLSRNYMENNNRKINIEITGIPVVHGENCKDIARKIGEMMLVEHKYLNIDVAHRLLTNSEDKIPAVIVKFKSREDRDKFFEKRSNLKGITIENIGYSKSFATEKMYHKIYINESLSVFTKLLFRKSREACRVHNYKHCYTSGGVVYVKKDGDSQKTRINHEGDLRKIK